MYMLFEIADKYVILFGIIAVFILALLCVLAVVFSKKNKVKPIKENERYEDPEEPIKVELKKTEELTEEQKKARMELERVFNQMNADLEKESERVVDTFEREQEENAIISYQELIRQVKGMEVPEKETSFSTIAEEKVKNEPITSTILSEEPKKENYIKAIEEVKPTIKALETPENPKPYSGTKTKFNSSEIISPIFGRQMQEDSKEDDFNVADTYTALSQNEEEKQNVEFLHTLKEFRNNL